MVIPDRFGPYGPGRRSRVRSDGDQQRKQSLNHALASVGRVSQLRDPAHLVSPRALTLWHVQAGIEAVVVGTIAGICSALWAPDGLRWWLAALVLVLCTAGAVVVPQWRYRVHRWEVSPTAVYTQRGWWARERRIAPMSRVQTVDFVQGPLARLFDLATVTVTTASAAGALQIEGLDREVALALIDELTRQADLVEGDAT